MRRRVELVDTSIVVEILDVPFENDHRVEILRDVRQRWESGVRLLLPLASVIECGAHVFRLDNGHDRRRCAEKLAELIRATLDGEAPWSFSPLSWDAALLRELIQPVDGRVRELVESFASRHLEMGDLLIVGEFSRLRANLRHVDVDVWTLDVQLRGVIDSLRS